MIFPPDRPICFVWAKWLAIATVGATPLLLVVAALRQSSAGMEAALAAMFFVPLMAACGYGLCFVVRCLIIAQRDDELPENYFPASWPFPFSLINWQYRLFNRSGARYWMATISLVFINGFVLLWFSFLLILVVGGILAVCFQSKPIH